jgi:hypothetical protein
MPASTPLEACPRCGSPTEQGLCHRATGLSFVAPGKLAKFVSIDEDLAKAGLRRFLPSPAQYYRSYLCRACNLYIVDYGISLSSSAAKELAASMAPKD